MIRTVVSKLSEFLNGYMPQHNVDGTHPQQVVWVYIDLQLHVRLAAEMRGSGRPICLNTNAYTDIEIKIDVEIDKDP